MDSNRLRTGNSRWSIARTQRSRRRELPVPSAANASHDRARPVCALSSNSGFELRESFSSSQVVFQFPEFWRVGFMREQMQPTFQYVHFRGREICSPFRGQVPAEIAGRAELPHSETPRVSRLNTRLESGLRAQTSLLGAVQVCDAKRTGNRTCHIRLAAIAENSDWLRPADSGPAPVTKRRGGPARNDYSAEQPNSRRTASASGEGRLTVRTSFPSSLDFLGQALGQPQVLHLYLQQKPDDIPPIDAEPIDYVPQAQSQQIAPSQQIIDFDGEIENAGNLAASLAADVFIERLRGPAKIDDQVPSGLCPASAGSRLRDARGEYS